MKNITPTMLAVVMPPKSKKPRNVAVDKTPDTASDYKEPSPAERLVSRAHDSKVRATADWIDGNITSKKHAAIHARADKVLKARGKMGAA